MRWNLFLESCFRLVKRFWYIYYLNIGLVTSTTCLDYLWWSKWAAVYVVVLYNVLNIFASVLSNSCDLLIIWILIWSHLDLLRPHESEDPSELQYMSLSCAMYSYICFRLVKRFWYIYYLNIYCNIGHCYLYFRTFALCMATIFYLGLSSSLIFPY